jgi:DNA topoisomerase-1
LKARGLGRDKVVAAAVEVLDRTMIRVGNREYAEANGSFGVTTLTDRHVDVDGSQIHFRFKGKSGKLCETSLRDSRLARIVRQCEEIPGQELFQYQSDDGGWQSVSSADVNNYLESITGERFTAKDFRTWRGTAIAVGLLREARRRRILAQKHVREIVKQTAEALGNTAAVCRKFYINPQVVERFEGDDILKRLASFRPSGRSLLDADEQLLLQLLNQSPRK